MRSILANLRTLVLPAGTTTGRRIVLDGVAGVIDIYDTNNELRLRISSQELEPSTILLLTGDPLEALSGQGRLASVISGSGGTRNLITRLTSPAFTGAGATGAALLDLRSESQDGTSEPAEMRFQPANLLDAFRLSIADGDADGQPLGVATLVAGTVTVSHPLVTADSRILLTCQTPGGTPGFLRVSARTAGTSFTILSSNAADTSVVAWLMVEPL